MRILTGITFALTLLNSWVLFEEVIVNRQGLWRSMACYRVGQFCEWDAGAIVVITVLTILLFRARSA